MSCCNHQPLAMRMMLPDASQFAMRSAVVHLLRDILFYIWAAFCVVIKQVCAHCFVSLRAQHSSKPLTQQNPLRHQKKLNAIAPTFRHPRNKKMPGGCSPTSKQKPKPKTRARKSKCISQNRRRKMARCHRRTRHLMMRPTTMTATPKSSPTSKKQRRWH